MSAIKKEIDHLTKNIQVLINSLQEQISDWVVTRTQTENAFTNAGETPTEDIKKDSELVYKNLVERFKTWSKKYDGLNDVLEIIEIQAEGNSIEKELKELKNEII